MNKTTVQTLIAALLSANVAILPAATPVIGVAQSSGSITIDNARTAGNATIFEGNTIETGKASSHLQFKNGSSVQIAADSRGKVYSDRMVLEKGSTQFTSSGKYQVDAQQIRVAGTESNSSARVAMNGPTVQVASISGTVRVTNAAGVLLANIGPGLAFNFTPQDAGAAPPPPPSDKDHHRRMGAGGTSGAVIVAGIVIAAAVGTTIGVLATQGESVPAQAISPGRP